MYRMVVTDLDGTLLTIKTGFRGQCKGNSKPKRSKYNLCYGNRTIRCYDESIHKTIKKNVDIVIGCDGAVIRNIRTGEILCENHLRSETCHTTFENL